MLNQINMLASIRSIMPSDGVNWYISGDIKGTPQTPYGVIRVVTDPADHYFYTNIEGETEEDELAQSIIQIDLYNKKEYTSRILLTIQADIYNIYKNLPNNMIGTNWKLHLIDLGSVDSNHNLYNMIRMEFNCWQLSVGETN
jgi:hypothetical protein